MSVNNNTQSFQTNVDNHNRLQQSAEQLSTEAIDTQIAANEATAAIENSQRKFELNQLIRKTAQSNAKNVISQAVV